MLIKVRVSDLESIPNFLVCTEGEDHHGDSWMVQCEVLQGELLGGQPTDEDPAPGPDDILLNGPFDFFWLRSDGAWSPWWTATRSATNWPST